MSFLQVDKLSVRYGTNIILHNVSFVIEQGEIISIVGPNGSGKSTLVKALLGLVDYEGGVTVEGKPLREHLHLLGYVPQRFDFDRTFPITVQEFLSLLPTVISAEEKKELLADLDINAFITKKMGSLSGGQLQRTLIVQALLRNPSLLIMDEPTAGIDTEGAKTFYEIVEHLNKEHNVTIVLISHETEVVYTLSDRVICLDKGSFHIEEPGATTKEELFVKTHHDKKVRRRGHKHS